MPWLSQSSRDAINGNITSIEAIYQSVKPGLVSTLGAGFSSQPDSHMRFAFCALVAFDLKPYVASNATRLRELMTATGLDCDNYVRLAWQMYEVMRPSHNSEIAAVGWEGPSFGNHAQMQIKTPGQPNMYCDPTIGLLVHGVDFDALCAGYQSQSQHVISFYSFNQRPEIQSLNTNVLTSITNGSLRASELLYVYTDLKKLDKANRDSLGTYPVRNG